MKKNTTRQFPKHVPKATQHGTFVHVLPEEYGRRKVKAPYFEYMFNRPDDLMQITVPVIGTNLVQQHTIGATDFFLLLN